MPLNQVSSMVSADSLRQVVDPYVRCHHDPGSPTVRRQLKAWEREWFWRSFWGGITRRGNPAGGRTPELVKLQYESTWKDMNLEELGPAGGKSFLLEWEGRYFDGNGWVIPRCHLLVLQRLITQLQPRRVLEVGFGRGLNLICLSQVFPNVEFAGLELTEQGVARTWALDAEPHLPQALRDYCPFPLPAERRGPRLDLRKGSAANMPFAQGEFDLVFSRQALEQMEAIRPLVMREMRRVCRGHAAFFEAFREWNTSSLRRRRNEALNYFNCGLDDLPGFGFAPAWSANTFPIKPYMAVGLAVAEVTS